MTTRVCMLVNNRRIKSKFLVGYFDYSTVASWVFCRIDCIFDCDIQLGIACMHHNFANINSKNFLFEPNLLGGSFLSSVLFCRCVVLANWRQKSLPTPIGAKYLNLYKICLLNRRHLLTNRNCSVTGPRSKQFS